MTEAEIYRSLQNVQTFAFAVLGIAAILHWRRRPTVPAGWVAAAFGALALVVVAGRFLPTDRTTLADEIIVKILVSLLVLFPYLVHRFAGSLIKPPRWERLAAHALAITVVAWSIAIPEFPAPGEPRSPMFTAYVVFLLAQWTFLVARSVWRLWGAGRADSAVTRWRMRTLSLGALTLTGALLISGSSPAAQGSLQQVITTGIALFSAPLMLIGFAPPRWLVTVWRRKDETALREAEIALVSAKSTDDVADLLLPSLSRLIGSRRVALFLPNGALIGALGAKEEEGPTETIRFEHGALTVSTSPLAPFFGEDERRTLRAIAALTDLTLERTAVFEQQQRNINTMQEFVAIASHDLQTPVSVISGMAQIAIAQWNDLTDDDRRDLIQRMDSQARHLGRLTNDLLTVSKMDSDVLEVATARVDLAKLIPEVVGEVARDHEITVTLEGDVAVEADPDYVKRVLNNYISNAQNYGAEPISVTAGLMNGWVEMRVSDCGAGVPEEFVPRLFQKFARADKKMSKASHGTGLGLSIVRGLARTMGGDAFYEPNRPTGATFGIRLKRAGAP